ncbi:MAG: DNA repair exonuclease [Clostridiales bacterium]|nr:DNA repair exonuclease [Clostridiales bacterium]
MLNIIHAADFHLDSPFRALPPEKAAARRGEQRALLERLAGLVRETGADLVLLAGDLLDSSRLYQETAQALARALGTLGVPVFLSPGNHDPYGPRAPYATLAWPDNVHIFTAPELTAVPLPHLGCVVHGCAFTSHSRDSSPLEGFSAPDDGLLHLLCLHGDVGGSTGRYGPIDPDALAASGVHYAALGHIHACSGLQYAGAVPWAYPGCPEGRGFDETGDKGVLQVSVGRERCSARFIPLAKRRYEILEVDVSEDPPGTLAAALPAAPSDDICRILLTGESDLAGLPLADLEAMAAPFYYSVTLRDRTTVRRDLWAREGEDTLTGLFLREMRTRLDACTDPEAGARVEQAVRFGLAALEGGEDCQP